MTDRHLAHACTDVARHHDPEVRAVFEIMKRETLPGRFHPETTCAEMVLWMRAMKEAGVIAGPEKKP